MKCLVDVLVPALVLGGVARFPGVEVGLSGFPSAELAATGFPESLCDALVRLLLSHRWFLILNAWAYYNRNGVAHAGRAGFGDKGCSYHCQKFLNQFKCQIYVGLFASSHHNVNLAFVALCEKFIRLLGLKCKIVSADSHREADAFYGHFFDLFFRLLRQLFLLVAVFVEIQQFGYRRVGVGGDLHQVHLSFLCHSKGIGSF